MRRRAQEAELTARLDYLTATAYLCVVSWPAMARKLERLYGPSLDAKGGQVRRWKVPIKAIGFRRAGNGPKRTHAPLKTPVLTPAARENRGSCDLNFSAATPIA